MQGQKEMREKQEQRERHEQKETKRGNETHQRAMRAAAQKGTQAPTDLRVADGDGPADSAIA
jgi:hypothetical protein